jgi:6-pyruvoyltetrahydropterin/6-carboxytetrahydropterin synthase
MESYTVIDGWKSNIRFSSAHIIPDYEKCGRLHGHTYAVHLKIVGEPDDKGIIMDFSILKDMIRETISELDHKILIAEKNSSIKLEKEKNSIKLSLSSPKKEYVFPQSDCVLLPIDSTSAENLARYILDRLSEKLPLNKQITGIEVGVDEGFGQGARVSKTFSKK